MINKFMFQFNSQRLRMSVPSLAILILCAFTSVNTVKAEHITEMLPADLGAYVELNNISRWVDDLEQDPLWHFIQDNVPARTKPQAWQALLDVMELSEKQFIQQYFGEQLVIATSTPGKDQPTILALKLKPEHVKHAVDKLQLKPHKGVNGYKKYVLPHS